MDGREIFVFFLAVQDAHDVDARAHQLPYHLAVAPEGEGSGRRRVDWHIVVTSSLRLRFAGINRVFVADGKRQFANLAALDFYAERGKAAANDAFVEHIRSL